MPPIIENLSPSDVFTQKKDIFGKIIS